MSSIASSQATVVPFPPFLQSFRPNSEEIIPYNNITKDNRVIGENAAFSTQWVTCSYPISGSYGPAPRYIFYSLAIFAMLMRKSAWIGTAALGSVMTYSTTAAIHAIVLLAIRSNMYQGHGLADGYYMTVLVEGQSNSGFNDGLDNTLWLPVLPMAWDSDTDAALAIVGTAFLTLLPMQVWSTTFRTSGAKVVLFLWSGVLLIGTICGLVDEAYVDLVYFPQLRFCPPGLNDTLPLTNSGSDTIGTNWDGYDEYYWNATVYEYFTNSTGLQPNVCLYPCFGTSWPLRDSDEINVGAFYDQPTDSMIAIKFWWLFFAAYLVVGVSGLSSLTTFIIHLGQDRRNQIKSWIQTLYGKTVSSQPIVVPMIFLKMMAKIILYYFHPVLLNSRSKFKAFWDSLLMFRVRKLLSILAGFYFRLIDIYAKILSPFAVLFFVCWIEWEMWTNDPPGETFRHIGQWGALVAAIVVMIGAMVGFWSSRRSVAPPKNPKNP